MARPVPFDTLEAREKAARDRLNRERRMVARLKRAAAQTQAAARMARLCALGEAVEAVCGPLTPEQLTELLRSLEPYGNSTPKKDMCATQFPQGETGNTPGQHGTGH